MRDRSGRQRVTIFCPDCGAPNYACRTYPEASGVTIKTLAMQRQEARTVSMWTADQRYYVNADKTTVVEEDAPDAAFLLVGEGGEIREDEARRLGLIGGKQQRSPANKQEPQGTNKGAPSSPPVEAGGQTPPPTAGGDDEGDEDEDVDPDEGGQARDLSGEDDEDEDA